MTKTEARDAVPGTTAHTNLIGTVTLVRHMNGESGIDGWEVRRGDGKSAFLFYEDFELTELEVDEIRNALRRRRSASAENTFIRIGGKVFSCTCGSNVFRLHEDGQIDHYRCNGCHCGWTGDPPETSQRRSEDGGRRG